MTGIHTLTGEVSESISHSSTWGFCESEVAFNTKQEPGSCKTVRTKYPLFMCAPGL